MSSTNVKKRRAANPNEFYATPAEAVYSLLKAMPVLEFTEGRWLEPAVGDGAIVRAVRDYADKYYMLSEPTNCREG
jgi:hypothetical protein